MQKKTIASLTIILLTSALLGSSVLTRGHFWGDDFAAYIMQAKSILAGNMDEFVAANTFTVIQSTGTIIGPFAYPWGFPLMLVPVYALTGLNPLALKLPGLLAYLGFLLVFFFLTKHRLSLIESLLVVSLFAFHPELLRFLNNILSDFPFLFFSTLAILLADMYTHETQANRRLALAVITGASIFAAFFVRTIGITLLGSMLLFQGIHFFGEPKQRHQLVLESLIIMVTFGILLCISALLFPSGESTYVALYTGLTIDLLKSNIVSVFMLFGEFFSAFPQSVLFFYLFVVLFFIGIAGRIKNDLLFVIYATMYLIALWAWPAPQDYRYVFPMLPFFLYFAVQGLIIAKQKVGGEKEAILSKMIYAFLGITVIAFAFYASLNSYDNLRNERKSSTGAFAPLSKQTYNFIVNNTQPDSIIVFSKPRVMRLMTDRDSLASFKCEGILKGDYLVLNSEDSNHPQNPNDYAANCNFLLDLLYKNRKFAIYQIRK